MRLPTAEMPLRMAVSMLFIMLLEVSGRLCTLPAMSLQHNCTLGESEALSWHLQGCGKRRLLKEFVPLRQLVSSRQ